MEMLWTGVIVAGLVQLLNAEKFGVYINRIALEEKDAVTSNENFSKHCYHYAPNEVIYLKCEKNGQGTLQFGYVSTFNYTEEGNKLEFRMVLSIYSNMSYLECKYQDIQMVKTVRVYMVLKTEAEAKNIRVNGLFVRLRYKNEFIYPYNGDLPHVTCDGTPATLTLNSQDAYVHYATCHLNGTKVVVKLINKDPKIDIVVAGLKDNKVFFKSLQNTKRSIYYSYSDNEYVNFHCSYENVPKFWQIDDIFKMNETRMAERSYTFERRLKKDYNLANIACRYAGVQTNIIFYYVPTERLDMVDESSAMTVVWAVLAVILLLAVMVFTAVQLRRRKQRQETDYAVPVNEDDIEEDTKETEPIYENTDTSHEKYAELVFNTHNVGMKNKGPIHSETAYAQVFPNKHDFDSKVKLKDRGNHYANEFNVKYSNCDERVILEPAYCEIGSS